MKNVPEALDRSTKLLTVERLTYAYKEALASAESLQEVAKIRDAAKVFHLLLQYHNTGGDMQHLGCEIKARADRRMGNLLSALERKPGTRTDLITSSRNDMKSPAGEEVPAREKVDSEEEGGSPFAEGGSDPVEDTQIPLAQILADLQIGPTEAWRWQQLAHIPDDLFIGRGAVASKQKLQDVVRYLVFALEWRHQILAYDFARESL
jgi:hypothetical protein